MAVDIKVAADEKLELVQTYITDTSLNSDYFNISELPDTFSGGKNAFLIAGTDKLLANTEIKIQIRDAAGNVCYIEYANGNPEYYEGNSKVAAVYVYPTLTAFGPATITILGQLKDVPQEWNSLYSVKWQRQININPALPNTTRVRFYKRPAVSITEIVEPLYTIVSGSKTPSLIQGSFASIKVNQLETFAGDVKRIKVYRTAQGDISDYDLIQDILVESKNLLTTYALSGSVVGNGGLFTNDSLSKLWKTGSLHAVLDSTYVEDGLQLTGSGNLTYSSSLHLLSSNTYELELDSYFTGSANSSGSNLGIYLSYPTQSLITDKTPTPQPYTLNTTIAILNGTIPAKKFGTQTFPFNITNDYPSASLYLSQSSGTTQWHVGNISLNVSQDTAFSPNEISFVTSMPTVLTNETFNFKFEFYDVNNNYVPIAVTQSAVFVGGTNFNTLQSGSLFLSASTSASLTALSQSVSGTIGNVTASVSQSFVTSSAYSASLQSSSLYISSSISGTISNVSSSVSGTISNVSQSASSSLSLVSQSVSKSIASISSSTATTFTDVNSRIFTDATGLVNKAPSNGAAGLYLGQSYLGYHNGDGLVTGWKTYMANNGNFFLTSSLAAGGYMAWDSAAGTLEIKGAINITGGQAKTDISNAANAASYALANANTASITTTNNKIFTDAAGLVNKTATPVGSGLYMDSTHLGYYKSGSSWATFMSSSGLFYLSGSAGNSLLWNGSGLEIRGAITATSLTLISGVKVPNASVEGLGSLATKSSIDSTYVTDLGTLATKDSVAYGSAYVTGFGALAARGTVNATYIDDNSITTGKILANQIVAEKIASLEFFGRNAQFNTGSVAGWNMDSSGLYKTTGAYTLRLASNAQKISITQQSTIDTIDRVLIDASTSIPAIAVSSTGSLNWACSGQTLGSINATSGPTYLAGNTGYQLADGGSYNYGTGVFGIIGLQYGEENIFVESENFPNITNTIFGFVSAEGGSYISGEWEANIRVRRFPSSADALAETNVDTTFGIGGLVTQQLAYRQLVEYSNYPEYNVDNRQIYGCTIPVTGGGGINSAGNAIWYRVEIRQEWSIDLYKEGTVGVVSVKATKPAADIYVKFGRVNGGYSVFSPGGLQVYQGVRNYLNASPPTATTGDASNFFLVKGKSQIIGSLAVSSGFTAGFKNFRIQHPLNENKWLYHTSTESPRADLIYRGVLELQNGEGSASIDSSSNMTIGTFDVLTKNPQLFLQNNESFDRIKGYVQSGSVYVLSENQNSTASIDWSVIAERQDTEMLKSALYDRHGKYKTESYKGEYLELKKAERLLNYSGSI
jgi:hypothetical protein